MQLATFSDTITLGSILLGALIGIPALWVYFKGLRWKSEADMRSVTIGTLRESNESLIERARELGTEKDEYQQTIAALHAEVETLRARPDWDQVVQLFKSGLEHVDSSAAGRQEQIMKVIVSELKDHDQRVMVRYEEVEKRAQIRHDRQMVVIDEMLKFVRRKE